MLIYWAVITLGPLVLAASLALTTSVASSASRGLEGALPDSARLLFDSIEFLLLAGGTAALYRYVPNTQVRWRHAWSGGVFVSVGIEVAKKVVVVACDKRGNVDLDDCAPRPSSTVSAWPR